MSDFAFSITSEVPGINHGYHIVYVAGHPRIAKKSEVEAWQTEVSYRVREARPSGWAPGRRVRVTYDVWFKRRGRDADGIVKFLIDGIAHGLGINDSIILSTARSNEVDKTHPRIIVEVSNED